MNQNLLHLSGCSYTWLHQESLETALSRLAAHGFDSLELTTASPHFFTRHQGAFERRQLRRLLDSLGLELTSVNPGFVDINVVSTNPEIQQTSVQQMLSELELAHDIGAPHVVLIPGRTHQLSPAPRDALLWTLERALDELVARAQQLSVTLTLENSPYGFLGTSTDQLAVVEHYDSPHLAMTYDVANAIALEDPREALLRIKHRLALVHISDTWRDRWAHTSVGRGEVDFSAFAAALREIEYNGTTVYELVDGEPAEPRLSHDLTILSEHGWAPGQEAANER